MECGGEGGIPFLKRLEDWYSWLAWKKTKDRKDNVSTRVCSVLPGFLALGLFPTPSFAPILTATLDASTTHPSVRVGRGTYLAADR